MSAAADTVAFWREAEPKKWFRGGAEFERACDGRFRAAHFSAPRQVPRLDGEG